jgi:hypothetical protein
VLRQLPAAHSNGLIETSGDRAAPGIRLALLGTGYAATLIEAVAELFLEEPANG